ncbi:unnamed protein product [Calypogeia fissa]
MGLFSRLRLYSQLGNGAASVEILDMVRFRAHSGARAYPASSGVIGLCTRSYLSTTFSENRYSQLKRSHITFARYPDQGSQQSKGDKNTPLWTKCKIEAPDLNHQMTRKALWLDGLSTPAWMNAMLKSITQDRLQSRASYCTRGWSQDTGQGKRIPTGNNRQRNAVSTNATELRHTVKGGVGNTHIHSGCTTTEAVAILKTRLRRGIATNSKTIC